VRFAKKSAILGDAMKKYSKLYSYLLAGLSISVFCVLFAQDANSSVDVDNFLKQNPPPKQSSSPGAAPTNNSPMQSKFMDTVTKAIEPRASNQPASPPAVSSIKIDTPKLQAPTSSRSYGTRNQRKNNLQASNSSAPQEFIPQHIPTPEEINKKSFDALKQNAFPLTPEQIQTLRNMLDDTQRATAAEPYDNPPEPVSSSLMVNLAPGSTPPAIRLYRGFVSSLVFVDVTGAPWPIVAYDLGNPGAFNIAWDTKDNILMVQAQSSYNYGNLAIKLKDLDTPVTLTLVPGQRAVDYRVDLRIMARGPNAKPSYSGTSINVSGTNPILLNILDAVPPPGAKTLDVPDATAQAWLYDNKVYLRTEYTLLSPAWIAKLSSADGMNAYELIKTPLVLLSRHGKTVQTKIEGF